MDLQLMRKGILDYAQKKKRLVLLLSALGFSSYGAYKIYNLPSIVQKRKGVSKLLGALISVAEVISDSAETIGVISKDFKDFLQSESDQIPNSLKQISKITRSSEFSESVIGLTQALTMGILRGYHSHTTSEHAVSANENPSFLDTVFDRLSTPAGSGFVSAVVGSFARNLVMAFFQEGHSGSDRDHGGLELSRWVDVVCGNKSKELIGDCIQLFVSTAVAVYLEKTMHINTYDEIFAGLTNPKHEREVRDVLVSVCNGAVETLVKTSHQVLTTSHSNTDSSLESAVIDPGESVDPVSENVAFTGEWNDKLKQNGWVSKVSSTLAVPSNRRLILDVTGTMTFETVRSFLEFLLKKMVYGLKRCVDAVHEAVVDCGFGVVRYFTAQSSVVAAIFVSVWLHALDGAWILVPA